jgi:hypothetical protein
MKGLTILFSLLLFAYAGFSQTKEVVLVDRFGTIECDGYLARMDGAIIQAFSVPNSKTYVYVYEGKTNHIVYKKGRGYVTVIGFPAYGLAKAKIRSMTEYLKLKKADLSRFVFVPAGFRERFAVEIWMVPEGLTAPDPTPTLSRMRYRRGKPAGFCIGCCGP